MGDFLDDYVQDSTPNWGPLEMVLPLKWCAGFMWMVELSPYIESLRTRRNIHLYKHGFTRHYLNLDEAGRAYRYLGSTNRYEPMDINEAIEAVFEGLEWMRQSRESIYDEEAVRIRDEQLSAAGWTIIRTTPEGMRMTKPSNNGTGG